MVNCKYCGCRFIPVTLYDGRIVCSNCRAMIHDGVEEVVCLEEPKGLTETRSLCDICRIEMEPNDLNICPLCTKLEERKRKRGATETVSTGHRQLRDLKAVEDYLTIQQRRNPPLHDSLARAKRQIEDMQSAFSELPEMIVTDGSSELIRAANESLVANSRSLSKIFTGKETRSLKKKPRKKRRVERSKIMVFVILLIIFVSGLTITTNEFHVFVHAGTECRIKVFVVVVDVITGETKPIHNCDVFIIDENGTVLEKPCTDYDGYAVSKNLYVTGMVLSFYNYGNTLMAEETVYPNTNDEDSTCRVLCYWNALR